VSGFGQILEDLNAAEVDYVLVGGIAMIRHGVVRATRDIDAVFEPSEHNVARIRGLIDQWKATRPDGSAISIDEVRSEGIPFGQLRDRADVKRVDGVQAPICSLADLVRLKRAAGRERDMADLSDLQAAHGELPTADS
jgi:hypothetical protein